MSVNLTGMQSLSALTGGMNYAQMIQQLTQVARAPGDALNQYIQQDELKKSDWSTISNLAGQVQSALVTLADTSTFSSFTATSSDTTVATATAGSTASAGTYQIGITQAGQNATFTSSAGVGAAATMNTTVNQTVFSQPITAGSINVTVGSVTKSVQVGSTDSLSTIISNINSAFSSTVISGAQVSGNKLTFTNSSGQTMILGSAGDSSNFLSVTGLAGQSIASGATATSQLLGHVQLQQTLNSSSANYATPIQITGGTSTNVGIISINNVQIQYNVTTDSLQSVITAINNSTAGVTAAYDPVTDKVTLTSKTSQPISVSDVADSTGAKGNLAQALGLSGTSAAGTQWQYTLNGQAETSDSNTVSNIVPGVTFSLLGAAGTSSTLTVTQDTSSLTKNVNAFQAAFNSLYSQLQKYTQLHGDLQGDSAAAQLGFKLMNDVLAPLANMTQYPNQTVVGIGISNGPIGSAPGTTNSIQIDQTSLLSAFQSNPSEVQALITGMAQRLNADLTNVTGNFNTLTPITPQNSNITGIATSEMNMYNNEITSIEQQQQTIYQQATSEEQILQQQFTQLQQYQSQASTQQQAMSVMAASLP